MWCSSSGSCRHNTIGRQHGASLWTQYRPVLSSPYCSRFYGDGHPLSSSSLSQPPGHLSETSPCSSCIQILQWVLCRTLWGHTLSFAFPLSHQPSQYDWPQFSSKALCSVIVCLPPPPSRCCCSFVLASGL